MNTNANAANRLPLAGLLALAMTGFLALLSEILPAGLLPQLSQGLGVSQSMAGQLTTFYAIGSVVGAVPIITATRNWGRRSLLLLTVSTFLIFNTITAISSIFILTMVARFFAGVAAGVVWGMLTGYARRMVPEKLKGRAVSIAMMGIPIALTFGLPLGTFLSSYIGWRSLFGVVSLVAAVLIGWILWKLPDFPGQSDKSSVSVWSVFKTPGVRSVLFVVLAWMTAHNILYTYISPLLASVGFNQIEFILLIYGIASIVSTFLIGRLIDRYLRPLVLGSLVAFILVTLLFGFNSNLPVVIYVAIILWGFVFGGAASLLQTAIAEAVDDQAVDIALSLSSTTWNFAIACGGAVGGILLNSAGVVSFPWVGFVLLIFALFVAWKANQYGFKSKV
ncbi:MULTISPECIES: MFS transporter [unclassified Paenibacillus]|uniref:MFS transporter n=1 Tax=unclassified Paenibacillus TaxID=185978 RepID=UPI00041E3DF6|nr:MULTISPECIES: MFS transporter [unclassified Paenibacillus]KGP83152.1 MFS transporter [Paenibacillus sp. MAEPY2]KGP88533.1 MFS transporter [Paenibacillus sp. MAEPY1]